MNQNLLAMVTILTGVSLCSCGRKANEIQHATAVAGAHIGIADSSLKCAVGEGKYETSRGREVCIPSPLVRPLTSFAASSKYLQLADTERCSLIQKMLAEYASTYLRSVEYSFGECEPVEGAESEQVSFVLSKRVFSFRVTTKEKKVAVEACPVEKYGNQYYIHALECEEISPKTVPQEIVDIYPRPHKEIANLYSTLTSIIEH